jgi:DNA-binding transcriptional ArsR family regulator
MHGLNVLFANRSQLMVLRTLHYAEEPLTGRGVERASGLSNRATMLALDALTDARAVYREDSGRAHFYTLNRNHYLVSRALRPAFDAEERFWEDLAKLVRRMVRPRPLAAVATGPLARDETDYGGRLLLTMLFSTGRGRIRAMGSLTALAEALRDRYALVLESSLLDTNTMDREEYIPLWRRVEREGILLFGTLP